MQRLAKYLKLRIYRPNNIATWWESDYHMGEAESR